MNTPCALYDQTVVFPVAPVDVVHKRRLVAEGGCPRLRHVRVGVAFFSAFGESCNSDCDESGNALVVATIATRSQRHVVRPNVCTSE